MRHRASDFHVSVADIADAHSLSAGWPRCSALPISQIAMNAPERASSTSSGASPLPCTSPTSSFNIFSATCGGFGSAPRRESRTLAAFSASVMRVGSLQAVHRLAGIEQFDRRGEPLQLVLAAVAGDHVLAAVANG